MPLQLQNALLQSLIGTSPYGILVLDQHNCVKCWSPMAETIFEIPSVDALDNPIDDLLVIDAAYVSETSGQIRLENTQTQRDSNVDIEIEQVVHQVKIDSQDWTILYLSDVTVRREKEQRLANEALTDPLSGLLNRRGFQERLESLLSHQLTLAIIDTDNFKQINDRFGHEAGDFAIQHVAQQLRTCLPNAECFSRLGGDEFGVVLRTTSLQETESMFEKLRQRIMAVPPSQHDFSVTVSIGVAMSNVPGTSARELLTTADRSMYEAKEGGRNQISIQPINV